MLERFIRAYKKLYGREHGLRERQFRYLITIGAMIAFLACLESAIVSGNLIIIVPLLLILFAVLVSLNIVFNQHKIETVAVVLEVLLTCVLLPVIFFLCGGIDGGATVWLLVPFVYAYLMFEGRKLGFFVALAVFSDFIVFLTAFTRPYLVVKMPGYHVALFDAFFSVIALGIGIGGIIHFQVKLFKMESAIAIKQKEEIEKLSMSKEKFFASMSHELRSPINSIIGLNEMVRRISNDNEVLEYNSNIDMASRMLLNLVNDILDFSQMEMKQMEIILGEYDTKRTIQEVVDMMSVRMDDKNLEFKVEVDNNLPSKLMGDKKRIQQVLINILTNAVKYTEKGSVSLIIYGETLDDETIRVSCSVVDTGIGIKKEDLKYLYDSFKRVDNKKNEKVEGSGLGLSITKELVSLMGGEIKVDSIYTKGSTFTVVLQQEIVDSMPIGAIDFKGNALVEKQKYEVSFLAPDARILVVDDNHMNTLVATRLLEATQVQVDVVYSGEECLQKATERFYHVILMDNRMSGMDGVETLLELRKQENGLCRESEIILCTAESAGEAQKIVNNYGFNGYLEKPISGKDMESVILEHLPLDIVEHMNIKEKKNDLQGYFLKKKRKVMVATDCVSDISEELAKKYDIPIMYLYIKTENGRFADTWEIESDSMANYISEDASTAYSDSASVEEYEEFFANLLMQAEDVIFISMAKHAGKSYRNAMHAAAGFDHVAVVDSGQISGGQTLLAIYAAQLARDGYRKQQILQMIELQKEKVETVFIMPHTKIFYKSGYVNRFVRDIFERFHLRPVLAMRQSRLKIMAFQIGRLEQSWRGFLYMNLRRKNRYSTGILYVTYAGCSVEQLEYLKEEINKHAEFEDVVFQKASFSNACNAGQLSIGIAYYMQ